MLYMLTDHLRVLLKTPLGDLVPNEERTSKRLSGMMGTPLVLVGDVTASVMTEMGFVPQLIIVDNHTKRGKKIPTIMVKPSKVVKVKNPAGILTGELFKVIDDAINEIVPGTDMDGPILIEVEGEEDLSTLAAIKLLPNGSTVVYGQPDSGLVVVTVNGKVRRKVEEMLREMEV
ncbi:MAG: DUF359 domain-containing protein [Candidatus Thermoplasmatota archaeon]|jgi:hypothetical protein|nr:DUF359 domain-containing protein [Candidatus Thermoplasmatota archaeon]